MLFFEKYPELYGFTLHYYDSYKDLQDYPLNEDQDEDDDIIDGTSTNDVIPGFELLFFYLYSSISVIFKKKENLIL